jgi:outer membrane protein assembly factor BamB
VNTSWPEKGPPVLWQKDVGEGYSGPVVAGNRVILFHRVGNEEVVECLDAATGAPQWKTTAPTRYSDALGKGDGPRSTPLVAGVRVYVLGPSGRLQCLDLKDGKRRWQKLLADDYRIPASFFGVGTSPLLEGNRLLVNVGARGAGIVAFDRDTGKEVWKATSDEASYASPVAVTADGVRHVLFFTRAGLVSLDPDSGAVRFHKRWRSRINASVNAASPVVADGHVFLTACYGTGAVLLRLKKDGVEEVWKKDEILSCHYNTPLYRNGFLYGVDGREDLPPTPELRCVEWKTGKVRWSKKDFGCAAAIAVGDNLLFLTESGDLVVAEARSDRYHEKARASVLSGPCRAHIALANGRLYGRDGKKLVCWDLRK